MAGFWARLFGLQSTPERRAEIKSGAYWCTPNVTGLAAGRGFNQQIVGESFYQDHIRQVAGGGAKYEVNVYRPVELREERWEGNPCIHALLDGKKCGVIPSADADALLAELRPLAALGKPVIAKGRIMGGFEGGHFGVEVSLSRPLRVRK